jgi:hypothetical protein
MKHSGIIASAMIILFALYIFVASFSITSGAALGPAFMPQIMGVILFALGIADFVGELKKEKNAKKEAHVITKTEEKETATGKCSYKEWIAKHIDQSSAVLLLIYVYSIKPLGFLVASAIYMFVHMLFLTVNTKRNYVVIVLLAVIAPSIIYFGFVKLFYLLLPPGILG